VSFSTTTLVVLAANGITAVIAAALLMLVLWQAPRQRMNQYFALTMLLLAAYCLANALGRFIDPLRLDPEAATYVAVSCYGLFVVAMYFFALEFVRRRTRAARALRAVGVILVLGQLALLWDDKLLRHIRPLVSGDGSYQGDWTALGLASLALLTAYLGIAALALSRAPDPRGRALWRAPVLVLAAAVSSALIWPVLHIPLQAVFLALAALALGLPVLRYELFSPLAALHAELARKNASLLEASRLKSQFLATMSHELRTPLNSIIGYAQLVVNGAYGPLNDTQRDRLEKVIRNGHTLLNLINDVLDLNRIEMGRLTLERQPLDVAEVLGSALEVIEPLATGKGLRLSRDITPTPPILADPVRARQIVTNILANAIKFTAEGGVSVRARPEGDFARLEIADTGIGIPPDQYDTVFAEFRQVDNSSTREYEGTGLGMAITKRLVELHGGRIWLSSAPGEGTTVYVTLPLASAPFPEPAPAPAQA